VFAALALAQSSLPAGDSWQQKLRQGHTLANEQRFAEAESALNDALHTAERLGMEDPAVAACLNSLALYYQSRGNADTAEPLFRRAIEVLRRRLDAADPEIGKAYFNLGEFYRKQRRFEEADTAFEHWLEVVDAGEETLFLPTLDYLALAHFVDRRFALAEALLLKSIELAESRLGPDNPQTARSWSGLGVVYLARDKPAKAMEAFVRSLSILGETEGSESDRAVTLGHLAATYAARLQFAEAEHLFERSLALHEAAEMPNRRELATVLNNLGEHYRQQREFEKAEQYLLGSRGMWEDLVGVEHTETATTLYNLASLYQDLGRPGQAGRLLEQSLKVFEITLGAGHPKTALAKAALAKTALAKMALANTASNVPESKVLGVR
jgi:tetratricopeptide (TPR) repeat protein